MITIKNNQEIKKIQKSGDISAFALKELKKQIKPGITTRELEIIARRLIKSRSAECAFLGYNGYPFAICVSINDEIVHGLPSNRAIKDGDLVSIDLGSIYEGFYSDMAETVFVGKIDSETKRLMDGTRAALTEALKFLRPGIRIGDLEERMGDTLRKYSLKPILQLSGHGIGKKMHEEPSILADGIANTGAIVKEGMVFAIEPMACLGNGKVKVLDDGWTVVTKDGSKAAHFEHTVAVTASGSRVLTGAL